MKKLLFMILWSAYIPVWGFAVAIDQNILKHLEYGTMLFLDNPGVDESGGLYGSVKNAMLLTSETTTEGTESTYFYQATYQIIEHKYCDPVEEREVNCKTKILKQPSDLYKRLKTLCDYVPQQYKELDISNQDWDNSPWAI